MKMVLKCEQYNYHEMTGNKLGTAATITHEIEDASSLRETLDQIEMFLRGCGFYFDGVLDIVPPDDIISKQDKDSTLFHHPV